jgi:hypothetical protein
MKVTTSRFYSALAAVVVLVGGYVASRFTSDPELLRLILGITAILEGLLIPAAAAPIGTVDALDGTSRETKSQP